MCYGVNDRVESTLALLLREFGDCTLQVTFQQQQQQWRHKIKAFRWRLAEEQGHEKEGSVTLVVALSALQWSSWHSVFHQEHLDYSRWSILHGSFVQRSRWRGKLISIYQYTKNVELIRLCILYRTAHRPLHREGWALQWWRIRSDPRPQHTCVPSSCKWWQWKKQ